MIFRRFYICKRFYSSISFGFFFDIDGVFLKGKSIIPAAQKAFTLLIDKKGKWKVPCVFVTNAGNKLRKFKAEELSERFQVHVSPDQVVMSHSPLRMFNQFHKKHVLVCGQGPVHEMAKILGFENVVTVDDLRQRYPYLDVCDHNRRKSAPCAFERYNKPIEAIVMFGEPVAWESNLQLLLDILMTNGQPYKCVTQASQTGDESVSAVPYPHISLLACNMDMQWMAESPIPRLGHGCFLLALETLYEKLSGRRLLYTALIGKPSELTYHYAEYRLNRVAADMLGCRGPIRNIYCVGDNPQTDIYGANLYNRYLETRHDSGISDSVSNMRTRAQYRSSSQSNSNPGYRDRDNEVMATANQHETVKAGFAESCQSILVLTGIVRKDSTMDMKALVELMSQSNVNHNHRDFPDYPELKAPSHVCQSVDEAVLYVFDKERFTV